MDTSSSVNVPARSGAGPVHPLSSSLMDKFLGMSISPASVQSLSSEASDANDLDELDEQEIWGMEISGKLYSDSGKGQGQGQGQMQGQGAPLPPRMTFTNRRLPSTPENRSPLKDSSTSWVSSTVNSLSSISGMLPGSSPLGSGGRSPAVRVLSSEATARRLPAASRMIPSVSQQVGEGSSSSLRAPALPQSAPLNIPHWSKLESRKQRYRQHTPHDDDNAEDEEEERLPPHEYLAREYARSQQASLSVLEGAGRTLKGRDLSRVRNAVLTYTGFVE